MLLPTTGTLGTGSCWLGPPKDE